MLWTNLVFERKLVMDENQLDENRIGRKALDQNRLDENWAFFKMLKRLLKKVYLPADIINII